MSKQITLGYIENVCKYGTLISVMMQVTGHFKKISLNVQKQGSQYPSQFAGLITGLVIYALWGITSREIFFKSTQN